MSTSNISIVGDSFGSGEYIYDHDQPGGTKISDSVLQTYLEKNGYQVENFSISGSSMQDILLQISENNITGKTIIVFATDSLRNIKKREDFIIKLFIKRNYSIAKLHKVLYLDWLKKMKEICQRNKNTVILIGGHANLYPTELPENILVCTSSWLSDIFQQPIGQLAGIDYSSLEVLMTRKPITTDVQKAEFVDIMTQKSQRLYLSHNHGDFQDDVHPGKQCHKLLAKKIIKMLG